MADTLDLITLAEAKLALNVDPSDTSQDTELASYITAVSRRLDDLCGPIVKRTITAEEYPGGSGSLTLRYAPISRSASTTVTSVTEYTSGSARVLAAEAVGTSSSYDYSLDATTGTLYRRAVWTDSTFAPQRVVVTYSAGRYATTAAVDPKFKQAAAMMLSHLWRREQGVGGSATFGPSAEFGVPTFSVPNAVVELLADEVRPPTIA